MEAILDTASWVLISGGLFFVLVGALGVLRMPDIYTRLHAAGMTDTMGAGLLILGLALQAGWTLVTVRLALVYLFLFMSSPVSSHALARAALIGKVEPVRMPQREG